MATHRVKFSSNRTNGEMSRFLDNPDGFEWFVGKSCRTEPMTREQEQAAFSRLRAGDQSARDELFLANQRFVIKAAKHFGVYGVPIEDLVSVGNIALAEAIDQFDETTGYKLISYAVWKIRSHMQREIAAMSKPVALYRNYFSQRKQMQHAVERLGNRGRMHPTAEELAAESGVDRNMCRQFLYGSMRDVSLNDQAGDHKGTFIDYLEDDSEDGQLLDVMADRLICERILADLPERTAEIFSRYFGFGEYEPQTLDTIGKAVGLTRERVRQIKADAISDILKSRKFGYVRKAVA